jgi:hypothetical protein
LNGAVRIDVFERAIVHDVLAEAIRLQVPLQAVESGIQVAIGAAELLPKGEARRVEQLLAAALRGEFGRAAERDGAGHSPRAVSITEMVSSRRLAT